MLHPLLPFRLFCRPSAPLCRPKPRPHRPIRAWLSRTTAHLYSSFGPPLGFLLGLFLALWALSPIALRG